MSTERVDATGSSSTNDDANNDDNTVTISFSVGGWLQMYHYGACQALVESGFLERLKKEGKQVRFSGSSAGSLAASALASESYFFEEMRDFALECGEHFRSSAFHVFMMSEYLAASISRFGTRRTHVDESLHTELHRRKRHHHHHGGKTKVTKHAEDHRDGNKEKSSHSEKPEGGEQQSQLRSHEEEQAVLKMISDGRLEVFVTVLPALKSKAITHFDSMDEVEEALRASCCMTPMVGLPFPLQTTGEWVIDGGIRAFQPRSGKPNTLTISPFYFSSSAHIKPSVFVPAWWGMRPPSKPQHEALFTIAFNDTIEYLIRNELIDQDEGVALLREEPEEIDRGYMGIAKDIVTAICYVVFLRLMALVLVYFELWVLAIFVFAKSVCRTVLRWFGLGGSGSDSAEGSNHHDQTTSHSSMETPTGVYTSLRNSSSWSELYQKLRNIVSLRVLLNLLFTARIPINTERLHKHSFAYRFFAPIVFTNEGIRSTWRRSRKMRFRHRARGGLGSSGDASSCGDDGHNGCQESNTIPAKMTLKQEDAQQPMSPGPLFTPLKKSKPKDV